jgi:alcohol dehydrogenase (cytochrome c)
VKIGAILLAVTLHGQVTYDRLLNAAKDPANWMTYSGVYSGWRYSALDQINRENVKNLKVK